MDGIPALDLWDLVIEVFHSSPNQTNKNQRCKRATWKICRQLLRQTCKNGKTRARTYVRLVQHRTNFKTRKKSHGMIEDLDDVDFISSNVNSSRQEALLYVFEDSEAVIKMIIKGRSKTKRLVSRTHRVAFDWLFDRINLDPKIRIKYIDTKTNSLTY